MKRAIYDSLKAIACCEACDTPAAPACVFANDVTWSGCHPIGRAGNVHELDEKVWRPLKHAFPDLERRDDIFIGGTFQEQDWISATGYYYGTFVNSWLGIPPHRGWAYLRYGEFYRLMGGKIIEAYVIFDSLDLMRQAGVFPWRPGWGVETLNPGPATHDGVRLGEADLVETAKTLKLVQAMLVNLFEPDRPSMRMERFWAPDMMWYGPALIGATRGIDGFFRYHTGPWVEAIPDWRADLQTPHFADNAYASFVGWPSIWATQTGRMYDIPPTGKRVEIRVMDWWRRDGALLAENWIFIDFPHLFLQLGIDLFARMAELRERTPRP